MMMEKWVERLAGKTEVLGENLPQCRFVHHKHHMLPGREPRPPRWEASDQPLELRHGRTTISNNYSFFRMKNNKGFSAKWIL
jgi:hypothetical protein